MIEINTPTDGSSGQYSALADVMRRRRSVRQFQPGKRVSRAAVLALAA